MKQLHPVQMQLHLLRVEAMKIEIILIVIILIIQCSTFVASANMNSNNIVKINDGYNDLKTIDIKTAILAQEFVILSAKMQFVKLLDGYEWTVGNKTYKFSTNQIYDKDIMKGKLNINNYDVLVVPGGGVGDGESIVKGFSNRPKSIIWKNKISNFIKNGGGYFSVCGGTALISEFYRNPETFLERQWHRVSLPGISCVKFFYEKIGLPIFCQFRGLNPDSVGEAAYMFYPYAEPMPPGEPSFDIRYHSSGVPLDVKIQKNHPIFNDFLEDTTRVRWISGPALVLPDNPCRTVDILAYYPEEEISDNESTKIYAWKYVGGFLGLLRGLKNGIKMSINYREPLMFAPTNMVYLAKDWKPTDIVIRTNYSNKPCMTAEIFPNEKQARIVLSGPHIEHAIWWGGHIEEMPDTDKNCLSEGFYKWVDRIPFEVTSEDESSYTWWMVRRSVAWASKKVPDNDLPPIYGPSQVSDIYPYNQSSEFTINGNAEVSDGVESLDLFYRYSSKNGTVEDPWGNWTLYDTDFDGSDGWSWEFNSTKAEGPGYYQFYSIRHVRINEYEWLNETAPPGPDAIVKIIE